MIGGSIRGVSLAGRNFSVAADADANLNVGGYENSVFRYGGSAAAQDKSKYPDPTSSIVMRHISPSVTGLAIAISDARGDQEFLRAVQSKGDFVDITLTLASGAIWQGRGTIVGRIDTSTKATTAAITLEFDGDLEQQT